MLHMLDWGGRAGKIVEPLWLALRRDVFCCTKPRQKRNSPEFLKSRILKRYQQVDRKHK